MIIIGCDYHPGFQQMAFVNTDTGELEERRLQHREEAEKFYRDLAAQLLTPLVQHKEKGPAVPAPPSSPTAVEVCTRYARESASAAGRRAWAAQAARAREGE